MAANRVLSLFLIPIAASVASAADLSRQLESIAAQRASVERQVVSAEAQLASLRTQRESVRKQAELVPAWKTEAPVIAADFPPPFDCPPISRTEAESLITSAADREALPPELLRAVIKQESGFKPCAVSTVGAQGLMQLMPATAVDLHVDNPFDPKQNIRGGTAYLKQLVTRYGGDLRLALSAYNAGMARVDSFGGIPDLFETRNYVSSITNELGYSQLPVFSANWNAPEAAYTADDTLEDTSNEPADQNKKDFVHLALPSAQQVFPNTPNFSRLR